MTNQESLQERYEDALFAVLMGEFIQAEGEQILKKQNEPKGTWPADLDQRSLDTIAQHLKGKKMISSSPSEDNSLKKKRSLSRYIAIAAAIALLLCGAASAMGFNVFRVFATWTTAGFKIMPYKLVSEAQVTEDPYYKYKSVVEDYFEPDLDIPCLPQWAPEETLQGSDIQTIEFHSDGCRFSTLYQMPSGEFTIRLRFHSDVVWEPSGTYQKDDAPAVPYESGDITHYLFTNGERNVAVWINQELEGMIEGTLSVDELKKMIDSIYWE